MIRFLINQFVILNSVKPITACLDFKCLIARNLSRGNCMSFAFCFWTRDVERILFPVYQMFLPSFVGGPVGFLHSHTLSFLLLHCTPFNNNVRI